MAVSMLTVIMMMDMVMLTVGMMMDVFMLIAECEHADNDVAILTLVKDLSFHPACFATGCHIEMNSSG